MRFCFERKDFVDHAFGGLKNAVIGEDFTLTWEQFENRVNNLCESFEENGFLDAKYPVIIFGHKSANMIVAIYAMMKLEIPYIPIDIIYPEERISKIVQISKSEIIINTSELELNLKDVAEICLKNTKVIIQKNTSIIKSEVKLLDPLVYIIFTSGSTGEPKGVQITTEAVQSFVRWMNSDFGFNSADVFINTAVLSFDLSVFEVMTFGGLGATILLNDKKSTSDPGILIDRIHRNKGTVWVSTPSFALLYSRIEGEKKLNSIRVFLFCGEVLPNILAKKLKDNFSNAIVFNTYGPTEATVATTLVEITNEIIEEFDPLPVGVSKRESELLIENDEIVIVGPNVSSGYLNADELNEQKFSLINGQRAFNTGDKGYLKDGMLFFFGRNDDLVKLHGYRIELNEITSVINNLSYVLQGDTIALKRNGAVKKIVSLVCLQQEFIGKINIDIIKSDIGKKLPHYMIPADIKIIDKIPLNQNGKTDKKLLTEIYLSN